MIAWNLLFAALLVALHAPALAWILFAVAVACSVAIGVAKVLVRSAAKQKPPVT